MINPIVGFIPTANFHPQPNSVKYLIVKRGLCEYLRPAC
jgi:hypothetical protein